MCITYGGWRRTRWLLTSSTSRGHGFVNGWWGHPGATSKDPWKHGLVAPQAAATELPVNGWAQWLCFVHDRWQEKSLRESHTRHVKIQCIHKRMVRFQYLTRNLFLTLHGRNVHRQQRQLSKFRMRYEQFASNAYCGAAEPVSNMASQQEKAFCVLRF